MNMLIIVAVLLTARVVVLYFGVLSGTPPAEALIAGTNLFVLPLGVDEVRSLYGGYFDANASVTIMLILLVEWLLSALRARF